MAFHLNKVPSLPEPHDPLRRARGWQLASVPTRNVWPEKKARPDGLITVVYHVPSARLNDVEYLVFVDEDGLWTCTPCPDYNTRKRPCKHIYEVMDRYHPDLAPPPPDGGFGIIAEEPEMYSRARRSERTWHAYQEGPSESTRRDHALMTEDVRVESLLEDLGKVLNERHPPRMGVGRPTLPVGDRVFAIVHRLQTERSLRKYQPHVRRLEAEGKLLFGPGKTSLVKYLGETRTTEHLHEAFLEVGNPYTLMERDFIVDATGFSPRHVSNWNDHQKNVREQLRTGRPVKLDYRKDTEWYKLHLVIGRVSRAVVAFELTPNYGEQTSDVAVYPRLVGKLLAAGFQPRFIIADNAYLSEENWRVTAAAGAQLHTPLRGRNFNPRTHLPRGVAKVVEEFNKENPGLADELERARQVIEAIIGTEKGHGSDNRLYAIGSHDERAKRRALKRKIATDKKAAADPDVRWKEARSGMFTSRVNEMYARMIRQVLRRTVAMEMLYNRRISYTLGSVFGPVRETVPEEVA